MKSAVKIKTRIGRICYVNCLPYYHQLEKNEEAFEFFEDVPVKINRALHEAKIDIAPISSLEYLHHQKDYLLLPDWVIGARDFSGSVLLFSKEKIEGVNGVSIAVSEESLSSVALLKVLLKFKYKYRNRFAAMPSDPDEMLSKHPAALVIGDSALFYVPKEFVYKYDLSELWWNWTEKPFCFAVWAVRREFAQNHPQEVSYFCRKLKKNVDRNLAHIETLMKEGLRMDFLSDRFPKIFGYLFNLNYGLDPSMREGLELFYRMTYRLGLSPRPKKLEFFKPD